MDDDKIEPASPPTRERIRWRDEERGETTHARSRSLSRRGSVDSLSRLSITRQVVDASLTLPIEYRTV